jgi:hypothetical protein
MVPLLDPSVTPRFAFKVKVKAEQVTALDSAVNRAMEVAVDCKVPPLRVIAAAVAEPGAVPRLLSALMLKVPALMDHALKSGRMGFLSIDSPMA